jgi:hypothetical protein
MANSLNFRMPQIFVATAPGWRQFAVTPVPARSAIPIGKLIIAVGKPFMLNSKQGAAVSLYLAASPEVAQVSGEYFVKSKPAKSNPLSRDPNLMAYRARAIEVIMRLADSFEHGDPLIETFLNAPPIRRIFERGASA